MSKAIIKYPGAVHDRWKIITDFVGTKTQKQVIAKAQELAKKSNSVAGKLVQSSTFGEKEKKKQQTDPVATPQASAKPQQTRQEDQKQQSK